jgi:hypothetical protein
MTSPPSRSRATRSESPSAKFYSSTFSSRRDAPHKNHDYIEHDIAALSSPAKRRRLNPRSDTEMARGDMPNRGYAFSTTHAQYGFEPPRSGGKPRKPVEGGLGQRSSRPSGSSLTKRASALNLHNYPADHHPVGIAIWVIQKIDSARRERNGSSSRESSPGNMRAMSSPLGIYQTPNQASEFEEGEDPADRRQAQRERKIKQRLENWAKSK